MGFKIKQKGNFERTNRYLAKLKKPVKLDILERYGREGVLALMQNTPVDSGTTRDSWYFRIVGDDSSYRLEFCNSNIVNDYAQIAILLQYGHATRNGGWVIGRDYINPVIQPLFDEMAKEIYMEVSRV